MSRSDHGSQSSPWTAEWPWLRSSGGFSFGGLLLAGLCTGDYVYPFFNCALILLNQAKKLNYESTGIQAYIISKMCITPIDYVFGLLLMYLPK